MQILLQNQSPKKLNLHVTLLTGNQIHFLITTKQI